MSNKQTDTYLEEVREQILLSMDEKDYMRVKRLTDELKFNGFEDESVKIWDELTKEQRSAYLDYTANLVK